MYWHYSKSMPSGKLVKIGVWENDIFIGVILFGRGANPQLLKPFELTQIDGCELVRIALNNHKNRVSKILSISIKLLKKINPKLRLIVSYADPEQNHLGKIYQAGNWVYSGQSGSDYKLFLNGRWQHRRSINATIGTSSQKTGLEIKRIEGKYRYLYPLDKEIREQIKPLAKPYPKKICDSGVKRSTTSFQDVGGGAIPTESLQLERQYA